MANEKRSLGLREWITGLLLPLAILGYTIQKDKADGEQRALDRITALIHSLGSSVEGERSMARSYIEYLALHKQADPEVVSLLSTSISTATTPAEAAAATKTLDAVQSHDASLAPAVKQVLKDLPARLYVEARSNADRPVAKQAQELLAGPDLTTPGIEVLGTGPPESEVRYYHPSDEPRAQDLAKRLTEAGIPTTSADAGPYARKNNSKVAEKTFELWLAPDVHFKERQ